MRDDNPGPVAAGARRARAAGSVAALVLGALASACDSDRRLAAADVDGAVLFVGSSTIARFPLGEAFPGKRCVNLGKGNEAAPDLRERLARVLPEGATPAGIVLYGGSADHRFDPTLPAQEIRTRVEGVVDELRKRAGQAPIALIEVLPARDQSPADLAALRALNAGLADLASARGLALVGTNRPPLADSAGSLAAAMSVDRHHLGPPGYEVLARWLIEDGGPAVATLREAAGPR
jgi:lysophospholipase L1-like esterase